MVQNTLFKVAEVEISYKSNYSPSERPQISTAKQAYEVFIAHWSLGKIEFLEEFKCFCLIEEQANLRERKKSLSLKNITLA